VILTVMAWPVFLLVTLTLEPNGSDLCAAVIALSLRRMPLAVLVPGCDDRLGRLQKPQPPYHRMTLSARASKSIGRVTSIASAARLLITNSNCVGCSIGNSPASVPCMSLATYLAS
jgi:hypothetical protein